MGKPMTLPSHEDCYKFSGSGRRVPPPSAGGSFVVRRADSGPAGWLRRRAVTEYSGLVFSVLDGLRVGGYCVRPRSPRGFQGFRNARGTTRPLRRHGGDSLCRQFRDVVDLAVLKNTHE